MMAATDQNERIAQTLADALALDLASDGGAAKRGEALVAPLAQYLAAPAALTSEEAKAAATRTAQGVADLCRSEPWRPLVQTTGLLQALSTLFTASAQDASAVALAEQLARALANATADYPENATNVAADPAVLRAVLDQLGRFKTTPAACRPACALLINLAAQCETARTADAVPRLLDALCHAETPLLPLLAHALGLTVQASAAAVALAENLEQLATALNRAARDDSSALETLLDAVESCAEQPEIQRAISSSPETLLALVTFENVSTDEKARIAAVVAAAALDDSAAAALLEDDAETARAFASWLSNDALAGSGALAIANLARSDAACATLAEKLGPELFPTLIARLFADAQNLENAVDARGDLRLYVQRAHAVLGALRNLSVASTLREPLGNSGAIGAVARILALPGIRPLHRTCAVILRNLCALDQPENTRRVLESDAKPVHLLVQTATLATDDTEVGTRLEACRAVAQVIKATHAAGLVALLPVSAADAPLALLQMLTGRAVDPISGRVVARSDPFVALQQDALVAAMLLCEASPDAIAFFSRWAPAHVDVLCGILFKSPAVEFANEKHRSIRASLWDGGDPALPTQPAPSAQLQSYACLFLETILRQDDCLRDSVAASLKPAILAAPATDDSQLDQRLSSLLRVLPDSV